MAQAAKTLRVPVIPLSTGYVLDGSKQSLHGRELLLLPNHVILITSWLYAHFGKNSPLLPQSGKSLVERKPMMLRWFTIRSARFLSR